MKGLYKFDLNNGKGGKFTGCFVEDDKFVEYLVNNDISFDFSQQFTKTQAFVKLLMQMKLNW